MPLVLTLVLVIGPPSAKTRFEPRRGELPRRLSRGLHITRRVHHGFVRVKAVFKMDTGRVLIDDLDDRLGARFVRAATPYLAVPAALLVVRVASHAVRNRDRLGLGTTLLDVAGSVLSLAGLDGSYLSPPWPAHFHCVLGDVRRDLFVRGGEPTPRRPRGTRRRAGEVRVQFRTDLEGTRMHTLTQHTDSAWYDVLRRHRVHCSADGAPRGWCSSCAASCPRWW